VFGLPGQQNVLSRPGTPESKASGFGSEPEPALGTVLTLDENAAEGREGPRFPV